SFPQAVATWKRNSREPVDAHPVARHHRSGTGDRPGGAAPLPWGRPVRSDLLPCGCHWQRVAGGDVLEQCSEHAAGAKYPGSEPMTPEEAQDFAAGLSRALGTKVEVIA